MTETTTPQPLHSSNESGLRAFPGIWLHRLAILVLVSTLILILVGGNVTSRDAGLAVPDWPLSFGSVNPEGWTHDMEGTRPGVAAEHSHRLIGALVGLLVTILTIGLLVREPRRWVKLLGVGAWIAVVIQGLMGGFRVTEQSLFLATVHGVFGQGFFALLVVIVAVTSAKWRAVASALGNDDSTTPSPDNAKQLRAVRMWAWIVFASVFLQVVLGAVLRHFGGTWIPHVLWAFVLAILLLALSNAVFMNPASRRWLGASVVAQMLVFGLQLMLGLVTLLVVLPMESTVPTTWAQAWLPTLHQGTGAVLVGLSAYLAVMASGLVAALGRTRGERLPSSSTPGETTASVSGSEALVS